MQTQITQKKTQISQRISKPQRLQTQKHRINIRVLRVIQSLSGRKKKILLVSLLLIVPLLAFFLFKHFKKPGKLPAVVGTYEVNTNILETEHEFYKYQSRTDGFEVYLQHRFGDKPMVHLETDYEHFLEFDLSNIVGGKPKVRKNKITWEQGNIKVEQVILSDRVKENIILKEKPESNEFKIGLVKSENLELEQVNDKYEVKYIDTEKLLMSIAPLYITDKKGAEGSGEMIFGETEVTIKVNQQFLDTAVYPITIDPTVVTAVSISNPTGWSSQRKTFYANNYYWIFYSDGTNMVYRTSSDGTTWSGPTTVSTAANGYEFALWLEGTTFYYALEANTYDIVANRGTISGSSISWDGETTVFNGTGATDDYAHDGVNIVADSSGYIWITDVYNGGATENVFAIRSTNIDDISAWESADTVITDTNHIDSTSVVALPSNQLYLIWYDFTGGASTSYWRGKLYNGTSWDASETTLEEPGNYTGDYEPTPAMVVDNNGILHVVLRDSDPVETAQDQTYLILSPPYSSSNWSETINISGAYDYDNFGHGLTLNTSDNTLTLFESQYIHCGGTVRHMQYRRFENGWMAYAHSPSDNILQGGGVGIDPSHRKLNGLFVYDADAGGQYEDMFDQAMDCGSTDIAHSTSGRMIDANTSDYVYFGLTEPFQTLVFNGVTVATGSPTIVIEYSQGSGSWGTLTNGSHGLVDNTSGFTVNTQEIRWTTNPSDWVPDSVNSSDNMYWVRMHYSSAPTTGPIGGEVSTMRQGLYINSNYSDSEKAFMIWADSYPNSGTYNINFYAVGNLAHDQRLSYGNDTVPTNFNFQRASFYYNGYYFAFFQDNELRAHPNNILYKTSSDGVSWSYPVEAADSDRHISEDNFSVTHNGNRVYLAYVHTDYDIVVQAGTIVGSSITWDTTSSGICSSGECTVLNGTSSSNEYGLPSIAVDSSGRIWLMARYDETLFNLRTVRSTYPDNLTSWSSSMQLGDSNDDAYFSGGHIAGSIVPLEDNKMYAVWYAGGNHRGELFNGISWDSSTLTTIGSTSTDDSYAEYTPTVVADNNNVIHVVYQDSNSYLQHETCAAPYGSSDWSSPTAVDGSIANNFPSLSLNTADNNLTLFYARQWASGAYQAAYKRYSSSSGWDNDPTYMGSPWEKAFDAVFVYDDSAGTYVDETSDAVDQTSADIAHTTSSSILEARNDYIYLGMDQKFDSIVPILSTEASSDGAITIEYSQGSSSWNTLPRRDGTNNLVNSEFPITFDIPIDWTTDTVNSTSGLYWVRIGWATAPTTAPVGSTISPVMFDRDISANYSSNNKTFATWTERDWYYNSLSDAMKKVAFYSPPIVDEPIHYHFNEGYGTTANDASGFDDSSSITNAVWKTSSECVTGNCLYFDGTGDYVVKTDNRNADFQSDQSFTLEAWIRHKSDNPSTQATIIAKYEDTHYDGGYKLYLNSSGKACLGIDDDNSGFPEDSACGGNSLADSKWHHIAGVKDGTSTLSVYVDGVKVATDNNISADNSLENNDDLYIGVDGDGSSYGFTGFIDEVKIHREARTEAEIKTDFIKGASTKGSSAVYGDDDSWLSDGLVGYWKLDETSTGMRYDSSGNGNDLTDNNTVEATPSAKFGYAADFENDNSESLSITDANQSGLDLESLFTIAFWVKQEELATYRAPFGKWGNQASNDAGYYMNTNVNGAMEFIYSTDGSDKNNFWTGNNIVEAGTWVHITVISDGQYIRIYKNGEELDTGSFPYAFSGTINNNDQSFYLGTGGSSASYFYDGILEEFRVYNRVLSPAEVQKLYSWAPGPISHWKLDEGSGSTAFDSSGNNKSLTFYGSGEHWTSGVHGSGAIFDGSTDYLQRSDDDLYDISGPLTMETWAYFDDLTTQKTMIDHQVYMNDGYRLFVPESSWIRGAVYVRLYDLDSNSYQYGTAADTITTNKWYHLAGVYDGTYIKIYVDGVLEKTQNIGAISIKASDTSPTVGGSSGGSHKHKGKLDDVRIYNYARTPEQIISDMNAGHPAPGSPVGSPVGYWKFDEGYGDTAYDSSPQGNNGDLGGSGNTCPGAATCPFWSSSGKFGKALDFEDTGTDDQLFIPEDPSLDLSSSHTISSWVNLETTGTFNRTILRKINGSDENNYFIDWDLSDDIVCGFYNGATNTTHHYNLSPTPGTWYHILCTFNDDTDTYKIYLNGSEVLSEPETGTPETNDSDITIGYNPNYTRPFDGLIDEVKIYNFALTAEQIKVEYNQGSAAVWGATSTASSSATLNSAARAYCPPGETNHCAPPVAEWNFDEGSGQYAYDRSENNNTGTLGSGSSIDSADPIWANAEKVPRNAVGLGGKVLEFDGSDDYTEISESSSMDSPVTNGTITISAWIYPHNFGGGGFGHILCGSGWGSGPCFILDDGTYTADSLRFNTWSGGGTAYNSNANVISTNQWQHVALTYNETTGAGIFYVNGKNEGSFTNADTMMNPGSWRIGDSPNEATRHFDGFIDNVRLYDYVRTSAQVAWEYNRGGPVGWWKFDEGAGTSTSTIYDSSGFGNNGSISLWGGGNTATSSARVSGKISGAIDFDGVDDFVEIPYSSIFNITDELTLSTWINVDNNSPGSGQWFFGHGYHYYLYMNTDGTFRAMLHNSNDDYDYINSGYIFNEGEWTHVALTFKDSTVSMYVNGNLEKTENIATTELFSQPDHSTTIGAYYQITGPPHAIHFNGKIDDARIYNYALTQQQINNLYNAGSAIYFGP